VTTFYGVIERADILLRTEASERPKVPAKVGPEDSLRQRVGLVVWIAAY
jgi:hypothetical protein